MIKWPDGNDLGMGNMPLDFKRPNTNKAVDRHVDVHDNSQDLHERGRSNKIGQREDRAEDESRPKGGVWFASTNVYEDHNRLRGGWWGPISKLLDPHQTFWFRLGRQVVARHRPRLRLGEGEILLLVSFSQMTLYVAFPPAAIRETDKR